jgi:hypothetical protein
LGQVQQPINLNSTEDFNKAMYYNYRELVRKKAEQIGNPPDYITFYSSNWVEDTLDNNPNFRNDFDRLRDDVYTQLEHNKRLYSVLGPQIVPRISQRSYGYIDRVRAILAAPLIVDWRNELNLTI